MFYKPNGAISPFPCRTKFRAIGHINHSCRLCATPTAINHQIHRMLQTLADFVWVRQRLVVFGQHQSTRQQRLAQFAQQRQRNRIIWHAQTNRFALWVQSAIGDFFAGGQNKSICPRCGHFKLAKLAVVHFGIRSQFAQIGTKQG